VNIRALQYFVALADLRHFSRAADACFVSQPTLSTQIKKLEDELGVQLVERAPRKVMLTPVGREVAERARSVLRDLEQIKALTRRAVDPNSGALRLGLFPTIAPYLLPHVVPQLRNRYPQLQLQLFEEKTADILVMLHQGKLDAGILALPVEDERLERQLLFTEPFIAAMPAHHPLAKRERIDMDDLRGQELLLLEEGHCLRDQALEVCQLAGAREKVDFHATSMETLRQMVAANVGITLMPILAVKPPIPSTGNLALKQFSEPPPSRQLAMFWRKSSALGDFIREISAVFSNLPAHLLEP
jgi:LysR family hydrogen peroxide-inducible transcriptional activator